VGTGFVGALRQNGPSHGIGDGSSFEANDLPAESFAARSAAEWDAPGCASQSPQDASARIADALCSRTQLSSRSIALQHMPLGTRKCVVI
jgi:hypothetical protein